MYNGEYLPQSWMIISFVNIFWVFFLALYMSKEFVCLLLCCSGIQDLVIITKYFPFWFEFSMFLNLKDAAACVFIDLQKCYTNLHAKCILPFIFETEYIYDKYSIVWTTKLHFGIQKLCVKSVSFSMTK